MTSERIYYGHPLLPQFNRLGIELDQRMQQAWQMCACPCVSELHLLTALLKLNTRGLGCLPKNWLKVGESIQNGIHWNSIVNPFPVDRCHYTHAKIAARFDFPIWMRAIELAGADKTITSHHFCRSITDTLLNSRQYEFAKKGEFANTPPLIDFLGICHGEHPKQRYATSPLFEETWRILQNMPRSRQVIEALGQVPPEPDDFQYVLCMEKGEIVFRATSVLADFHMRASDGSMTGNRGLLTHLKEKFGLFTPDEIGELQDLLRNPKSIERDFQKFFESHPHFFRRWDYREVYSQVYLARDDQGPLVPDFILTNPEIQEATILELKLPKPKLIRRQENRDRFAAAVMEARSQLLEYRDWFEDKGNREKLIGKVKMEIFRPRLAVVIGRSADCRCAIDRQKLAARTSDIDVVTYDDVVACARRRMVSIGSRSR